MCLKANSMFGNEMTNSTVPLKGQKNIFQCFYVLSQFYSWVIILYIIAGHQRITINMRGIEIAYEC